MTREMILTDLSTAEEFGNWHESRLHLALKTLYMIQQFIQLMKSIQCVVAIAHIVLLECSRVVRADHLSMELYWLRAMFQNLLHLFDNTNNTICWKKEALKRLNDFQLRRLSCYIMNDLNDKVHFITLNNKKINAHQRNVADCTIWGWQT